MVQRRTTFPTAHKIRAPASKHTTHRFESYLYLKTYVDLLKGLAAMLATKKSVGVYHMHVRYQWLSVLRQLHCADHKSFTP